MQLQQHGHFSLSLPVCLFPTRYRYLVSAADNSSKYVWQQLSKDCEKWKKTAEKVSVRKSFPSFGFNDAHRQQTAKVSSAQGDGEEGP